MKVDIGNRWVWITGASSGIGAELAKEAARKGGRILLSGRNLEALATVKQACEEISRDSGRAGGHDILAFDLLDRAERAAAVQKALALSGGLALLVLNAGASQRSSFEETTPEAFDRIMELDFNAPVDLVRRVLPSFGARRDRKAADGILFISSVAGLIGAPRRSAYSAAKHALAGFASVLRGELRDRGISVTVAFPGYVRTGIGRAALGGDGKPIGKDDPDIEHGADPARTAARIMAATLSGRPETKVALSLETRFAIFSARRLPALYARLAAGRARKLGRREARGR